MGAPPLRLGHYELVSRLATGGMAHIYLAKTAGDEGFEKHVVIKLIRPELASDRQFVRMFLDEARLAARLQHQNIVQVHDIGCEGEACFFAMEYLHGADLRALLRAASRRNEQLPLAHALTIAVGAASGLHYAHERVSPAGTPLAVIHRDVSPSNIHIAYDGSVKLLDFGIAHAAERTLETRTGTLKGKVPYMSPEQCLAMPLDRRSDIFSLGVVLYELTTVTRLFPTRGAAEYSVMHKIVNGTVPRPSSRVPGYPPDLERIVMRALARNRDERYGTVGEMLVDLERVAERRHLLLSHEALAVYLESMLGSSPEPWCMVADESDDVEIEIIDDSAPPDDRVAAAADALSEQPVAWVRIAGRLLRLTCLAIAIAAAVMATWVALVGTA